MKVAVVGAWHVHTKEYAEAIKTTPIPSSPVSGTATGERGEAFAKEFGIPFSAELETIWSDPSIAGVQITTATCEHHDVLIVAA